MADRRQSVTSVVGHSWRKFSLDVGPMEAAVLPGTEKSAARAAAFESEPALEEHYKPIPTYEGIHRYDPQFNWSHIEEKKLVRRVGPIMTRYHGLF